MEELKNERGITLIVLIITVIVMIILAGIVINDAIGEGGLIGRAEDATNRHIAAENHELNVLNRIDSKYDQIANRIDGGNSGGNQPGTSTEPNPTNSPNPTTNPTPSPTTPTDGPVVEDKSGASIPNLNKIAQKTYVTWDLNSEETEYVINDTHTTPPTDWYDYDNGKWANIKTTNKISDTETLEAYWVWIPRYEYIVPTSKTATKIEAKFIPVSQTEPDAGYTIHPAFTNEGNGGFGELDGIWVGKFEASSNTEAPDSNYGGGEPSDTNPLKVQVKPGVQSWRNISVKSIFTVCRSMTNEGEVLAGSTVDSHMMKNTEWGAVAILSQSKYGVYNPQSSTGEAQGVGDSTKKVWNNPYGYKNGATIKTGYVGNSADASTTYSSTAAPTNVIEYNKKNKSGFVGPKASTTGTVYGVYDMAGGSLEYVAGVLKGNSTDGSSDLLYATSFFDITNQGKPEGMTDLNFAKKYLDLYNYRTADTDYSQYIIGDATVETKEWNSDYSIFVDSSDPVFVRGR